MTPNYIDSSATSLTVSPSCSCRGSGNMEEECEKFLKDFTENPCLRNAIQAFGNGTDINFSPKSPPLPPITLSPKMEKSPSLPDNISDSNTIYDTSVITTCTSIQIAHKSTDCETSGADEDDDGDDDDDDDDDVNHNMDWGFPFLPLLLFQQLAEELVVEA
ncbi:hypothetical protein JD844_030880 [Phrynosoma platyrhinos]|uniref:GDNF family receptor alpha-2 n=1 Tax=Phrynosoma platyrhinos TaxID=52577 RepID=A0ABQ7T086_PHRPL|nr:hypothetical protein JD844_030880 [Phrynosoma platyrhinos]